jgi:hypothetical protein
MKEELTSTAIVCTAIFVHSVQVNEEKRLNFFNRFGVSPCPAIKARALLCIDDRSCTVLSCLRN